MKYTYATLLLHETGAEINEQNLTNVLESAEADEITASRIKALVAALEDVDIAEYASTAAPATVEATNPDDVPADTADEPSETQDTAETTEDSGLVFGQDTSDSEADDTENDADETAEDTESETKDDESTN